MRAGSLNLRPHPHHLVPVGGEVRAFHVRSRNPGAADARTRVEDRIAAEAMVDRVEGLHQATASLVVPRIEQIALAVSLRRELGQHAPW